MQKAGVPPKSTMSSVPVVGGPWGIILILLFGLLILMGIGVLEMEYFPFIFILIFLMIAFLPKIMGSTDVQIQDKYKPIMNFVEEESQKDDQMLYESEIQGGRFSYDKTHTVITSFIMAFGLLVSVGQAEILEVYLQTYDKALLTFFVMTPLWMTGLYLEMVIHNQRVLNECKRQNNLVKEQEDRLRKNKNMFFSFIIFSIAFGLIVASQITLI